MEIFKFGGGTLKDAAAIKKMGEMMRAYKNDTIIIVVSAFGKVTQMLEEIVQSKIHHKSWENKMKALYAYHLEIVQDLFGVYNEPLEQALDRFQASLYFLPPSLESREAQEQLYSHIVSWGENLSSKIIAAYLAHIGIPCQWVDARSYIKTEYGRMHAIVDQQATRDAMTIGLPHLLEENNVLVMPGFIGSDSQQGYATTLGKEGSDYTGALLAANLQARALRVWKDVPGVMTGDPKLFEHAQTLPEIPYEKMFEMAYYGAQVIHPNTITPLAINKIPLYIHSFTTDAPVTVIHADVEEEHEWPTYILRSGQVWLQLAAKDNSPLDAKPLGTVFVRFNRMGVNINFLDIASPQHIKICFTDDGIHLQHLVADLQPHFQVTHTPNASLLTILNGDKAAEQLPMLRNATVLAQVSFKKVMQTVFI